MDLAEGRRCSAYRRQWFRERPRSAALRVQTNRTGHLAMHYQVPLDAADADRVRYDYLRVHHDSDGDGVLDQSYTFTGFPYDAEPTRRVVLPIAKAVNYVRVG